MCVWALCGLIESDKTVREWKTLVGREERNFSLIEFKFDAILFTFSAFLAWNGNSNDARQMMAEGGRERESAQQKNIRKKSWSQKEKKIAPLHSFARLQTDVCVFDRPPRADSNPSRINRVSKLTNQNKWGKNQTNEKICSGENASTGGDARRHTTKLKKNKFKNPGF